MATAQPLPPAIANLAAGHLRNGFWQQAADVIVDQLVKDGVIDRAKLAHGKIQYDPTVTAAAATRPWGFRRNPTGGLTAVPRAVRLGKDAFQHGLPWLYSSILHEYQHVMQDDTVRGLPTIASRVPGQAFAFDILAQRQIEALAEEISNANATHLDREPSTMRILWHQLHAEWMKLNWHDRAPVKDIYESAYKIVKAVPGIGSLHYLRYPP